MVDLPEDPDRRLGELAGVGEPGERERGRRVVGVCVVDEQVGRVDVGDVHHPHAAGGGVADDAPGAEAVLAGGAEPDRLAVLERDDRRRPWCRGGLLVDRVEGAVVEDRAVLVDLHQGGAPVGRRGRRAPR